MSPSSLQPNRRLSRRDVLQRTAMLAAAGLAWPLVGCGSEDNDSTATAGAASPTASALPGTDASATATSTAAPAPTSAATMTSTPAVESTATATQPPAGVDTPAPATATATLPVMHQTWRQIVTSEPPPARRDHSLSANGDGSLTFLFGGRNDAGALGDLWVYNRGENSWAALAPANAGPAARFGHNAAFDPRSGSLLIFGGQAGTTFYGDLWAYDPATNTWAVLAEDGAGPAPRYGAAGAIDPERGLFYISHGFTNQGRFDDTWAFVVSDALWRDLSPAGGVRPEPRCLVRMTFLSASQQLLLFGGQSNSTPFLDDVWIFDTGGQSWQQLDIVRSPARNLYAMTMASAPELSVLYGGNGPNGPLDDIWRFDPGADTWQPLLVEGSAPQARSGHDLTWLSTEARALSFGGRGADGDLNDLWELTPG